MDVSIKLFEIGEKAGDGSFFRENVVREYLNSNECKNALESHQMVGGVTHHHRVKEPEAGMAQSDHILMEGNLTHYIKELFIKDNALWGMAVIMDDLKDYDEESKKYIATISRALKNGINLPISMSIKAYWNERTNEAEKIIDILGFDFTLDPSFRSAGVKYIERR